jgi:hypothetical protein
VQHAGPVGRAPRRASPVHPFATAWDSPVSPDSSTSRSPHSEGCAVGGERRRRTRTQITSPTRSAPAGTSSRPPSSAPPRISRCATTACSSSSDSSTVSARKPVEPADQRAADPSRRRRAPRPYASTEHPRVAAAPRAEQRVKRVGPARLRPCARSGLRPGGRRARSELSGKGLPYRTSGVLKWPS